MSRVASKKRDYGFPSGIERRARTLLASDSSRVVAAPAAFGKTSLLRCMAQQVSNANGDAEYLTLDERTSAAKITRAADTLKAHASNLLALDVIATKIASDVDTVLARVITDPNVRVIVATRKPAAIRALRYAIRGDVQFAPQSFLALDSNESASMSHAVDDNRALAAACAGWPGPLAWLARSNRGAIRTDGAQRRILLYDYVISEVFDGLRCARLRRALEIVALGTLEAQALAAAVAIRGADFIV